jgi:hypothetical protein
MKILQINLKCKQNHILKLDMYVKQNNMDKTDTNNSK